MLIPPRVSISLRRSHNGVIDWRVRSKSWLRKALPLPTYKDGETARPAEQWKSRPIGTARTNNTHSRGHSTLAPTHQNAPYYAASWAPTATKGIGERESRSYTTFPSWWCGQLWFQSDHSPWNLRLVWGMGRVRWPRPDLSKYLSQRDWLTTNERVVGRICHAEEAAWAPATQLPATIS